VGERGSIRFCFLVFFGFCLCGGNGGAFTYKLMASRNMLCSCSVHDSRDLVMVYGFRALFAASSFAFVMLAAPRVPLLPPGWEKNENECSCDGHLSVLRQVYLLYMRRPREITAPARCSPPAGYCRTCPS
jgi:hypothetical protein